MAILTLDPIHETQFSKGGQSICNLDYKTCTKVSKLVFKIYIYLASMTTDVETTKQIFCQRIISSLEAIQKLLLIECNRPWHHCLVLYYEFSMYSWFYIKANAMFHSMCPLLYSSFTFVCYLMG